MEDRRAETLEALSTFIETQRLALSRTQSDIERLRKLRNMAVAEPAAFLSNLTYELDAPAFKLSQQDHISGPPEQIDWSLYASHDPKPLRALALTARVAYAQRNQPHTSQRSDLSDLQKFVKEARRTIIDPILTRFALEANNTFELEEEEEIDPEEVKREREREKIRELKKRKIRCGLTIPFRSRGPNGVFIRRDLEDESADVDISLDVDPDCRRRTPAVFVPDSVPMDVDATNISHHSSAQPIPSPSVSIPFSRPSRSREPSIKLRENMQLHAGSFSTNMRSTDKGGRRKSKSIVTKSEDPLEPSPPDQHTKPILGKRTRDSGKPKSETYKQSWSVSEQHLLERLLEEIPEGEKNRWQKISRAMMGRRTPRQVASRVQKYFEKLKRFGVGGSSADVH